MDWQPIETAPKDGTHIIAWPLECNKGSIFLEAWYKKCDVGGYWLWCDGYYGITDMLEPTHWLPLPELPDVSEDK